MSCVKQISKIFKSFQRESTLSTSLQPIHSPGVVRDASDLGGHQGCFCRDGKPPGVHSRGPVQGGPNRPADVQSLSRVQKESGGSVGNSFSPLCTEKLTSGQQRQPHLSSLARKDGITPLIMAAAMNHDECVDLLLSAGVDPNEESKVSTIVIFCLCYYPKTREHPLFCVDTS